MESGQIMTENGQYELEEDRHEESTDRNEDAIDRLRTGPKSIMNIIIVLINILVFFLVEITGSSLDTQHMIKWGAAYTPLINAGEYYRLLTSMFLHFGLDHLFNNMILLVFIGDHLEKTVGKLRYLLIYIVAGLGASAVSWLHCIRTQQDVVAAGASGAVFAVIGALLYILIRNKGRLQDLSLGRMALMAGLSLYVGFTSTGIDNYAHVGGLVCGFLLSTVCYRKKTGSSIVKQAP